MNNTHSWAKCGIMARASLETNAVHAMVEATPSYNNGVGVAFQFRGTAGSSCSYYSTPYLIPPLWVRLVRSGNTFRAYQSSNGTSWSAVGSSQTLSNIGASPYVGLALTSHTTSALCTSVVDQVTLTVP